MCVHTRARAGAWLRRKTHAHTAETPPWLKRRYFFITYGSTWHDSSICAMRRDWCIPPTNGEIALWPNARVVQCKYYVSLKRNGCNNKIMWYNICFFVTDACMSHMTPSYVRHDSVGEGNVAGIMYVWHDSSTWLIEMWDMAHWNARHDSFIFICVTWLIHIHMCDLTWLYVWHDSPTRETWLIRMWDMTQSKKGTSLWCVRHDTFICVRHDTFICVTWRREYVVQGGVES